MSHTYASNIVHCVFSTKDRAPLIPEDRQQKIWAYLCGILKNIQVPLLAVGGVSNHVHLLMALPPTHNLAKVICDLKANSSRWLNESGMRFAWQEGYGAFSVSPSRIDAVKRYIRNQGKHHQKRNFQEEFVALLNRSGIPFDPRSIHGTPPLTRLRFGRHCYPALTRWANE